MPFTMKKLTLILLSISLIASCTSKKELTNEEAINLIKQDKNFPSVIDYEIYCSDPASAKKVLNAGLESAGLVAVQRTQKLADVGKPLISFTAQAQPYLLPTSEKEKSRYIQKVKLADEDIAAVSKLKTNEAGDKAFVEYTTTYKNVTPFSPLLQTNYNQSKKNKAYFTLSDTGWKLEKNPDISFVELEK